jgi:hypothetical protein
MCKIYFITNIDMVMSVVSLYQILNARSGALLFLTIKLTGKEKLILPSIVLYKVQSAFTRMHIFCTPTTTYYISLKAGGVGDATAKQTNTVTLFPVSTDKRNKIPCFLIILLSYDMFWPYKVTVVS